MKKGKKIALLACVLIAGTALYGCGEDAKKTSDTDKPVKVKLEKISTADVEKNIDNNDYIFVDTRNDSYYNGFKQGNQKRGGHIPGAIQYTADWIGHVKKDKLAKFVEDKGIKKDKKIVVYDSDKENVENVGSMLKGLGYNVLAYDKFDEYVKNSNDKLNSYPKYEQLVNPEWVKSVIDGKKPETFKSENPFKIFEVSWGPMDKAKDYNEGHIKGAYHFDTDWIEEGPVWNLRKPEEMKKNLEAAGITSDTTVVLYSADQSAPFRVMFALKWAGVKDVRVLNGGMYAWNQAGYKTEKTPNKPEKVKDFGTKVPADPSIDIATAQDAVKLMKSENLKLISNRSWDEYTGKTSGYDYIPRKGEPKGAIYGFAGSDAFHMENYYDPDNTLRNPVEIMKLLEGQGVKEKGNYAFYCGTGWRAAVPWEMTQMLGLDNFKVYDGGWNSWQMDKNLPVQEGAPENMKKPDAKNDYE